MRSLDCAGARLYVCTFLHLYVCTFEPLYARMHATFLHFMLTRMYDCKYIECLLVSTFTCL